MAAKPIIEYESLYGAMCKFVTNNLSFDSSAVDQMAATDIGAATDLTKAALAPIRHRAINFEEAVKFGFAVQLIADQAREEDPTVPAFDLVAYNKKIAEVFDIATEGLVWTLCDDDTDEEDDEDEDDEEVPDLPDAEDDE
jgi:hypothetical protein